MLLTRLFLWLSLSKKTKYFYLNWVEFYPTANISIVVSEGICYYFCTFYNAFSDVYLSASCAYIWSSDFTQIRIKRYA